jgi:hypothetical protein
VLLGGVVAARVSADELIRNGNFEQGDKEFKTKYRLSRGNIRDPGTYDIVKSPQDVHDSAAAFGDHTTGKGYMLVVNGGNAADDIVWAQTVAVLPGSEYTFSLWVASWYASAPAEIEVVINGKSIGKVTAPDQTGEWKEFKVKWKSERDMSAVIEIFDRNREVSGNDFALDDISLQGPPAVRKGGNERRRQGFVAARPVAAPAGEKLNGIACRSVHLWFPAPVGTAFYNEVTVEQSAPGTYFMACGWSKGYFGIQELASGKKVLIFSVWDPASGDNAAKVPAEKRVNMLHKDPAVRVGRFGNEGTGGQSFLDYDWKVNVTYRFLVTARPDGPERTAYAGYFYLPEKKEWIHLVTFSTLTPKNELLRGYYSFVEDFRRNKVSTTQVRKSLLGNGWVKTAKGEWQGLEKAQFTADNNPATNIDAGVVGARFFLATGGDTANTHAKLRETITRKGGAGKPPSDLPKAE